VHLGRRDVPVRGRRCRRDRRSIVHPLRWPCSWHRKHGPRLARIVDLRSEIEIEPAQVMDPINEVLRRKTPLLAQIID